MVPDERELLEEMKKSLKASFHKDCVDAYLKNPSPKAVADQAIQKIQKVIDETQ